jgi:hypothetical protein
VATTATANGAATPASTSRRRPAAARVVAATVEDAAVTISSPDRLWGAASLADQPGGIRGCPQRNLGRLTLLARLALGALRHADHLVVRR